MQSTPDITLILEILKIAIPSVTSIGSVIILGLWLNGRNEKIKAELQKQFYESQVKTEERKLHLYHFI